MSDLYILFSTKNTSLERLNFDVHKLSLFPRLNLPGVNLIIFQIRKYTRDFRKWKWARNLLFSLSDISENKSAWLGLLLFIFLSFLRRFWTGRWKRIGIAENHSWWILGARDSEFHVFHFWDLTMFWTHQEPNKKEIHNKPGELYLGNLKLGGMKSSSAIFGNYVQIWIIHNFFILTSRLHLERHPCWISFGNTYVRLQSRAILAL